MDKHHYVLYTLRANKRIHHPFKLVHYDIWGHCPVSSVLSFKYFIIFVNDLSCVTWLYLKINHSEALFIFQTFYNEEKNRFGAYIYILRLKMQKNFFVYMLCILRMILDLLIKSLVLTFHNITRWLNVRTIICLRQHKFCYLQACSQTFLGRCISYSLLYDQSYSLHSY